MDMIFHATKLFSDSLPVGGRQYKQTLKRFLVLV